MNTTTQQDTQAAANKAAEEGGLPRLDQFSTFDEYIKALDVYDANMRSGISSDRASRQAAEKVTCGFCKGTGDGEIGLHGCTDCNGKGCFWEPIEDEVASRQVANKAEVDLSSLTKYKYDMPDEDGRYYRVADVEALLATPPATTGASTAPANASPVSEREISELRKLVGHGGVYAAEFADNEQLMACFWSIIGQINKQLERKPVGASTALTDERIKEEMHTYFSYSGNSDNKFWAHVDDIVLFAQWAAAQAGQVAVPEEELARFCPACGSVGDVGPAYRDCCPDGNEARRIPKRLAEKCHELFKAALSAMIEAAPSPAKESK